MSFCHGYSHYNPQTSILAGMSVAQLQAFLVQAQNALITLRLGMSPVTVQYSQADGSKSTTFRATDMGSLTALIMQLQMQLGIPGVRRRALSPVYI